MKKTTAFAAFVAGAVMASAAVADPCDEARNGALRLTYDTGVSQLNASQKAELDTFAGIAKTRDAVCIFSQVDNQGSEEANRRVATARGEAVRAYLEAQGVRPGVMEVRAQSKTLTLFGLLDDDNANDRRVTVTYK